MPMAVGTPQRVYQSVSIFLSVMCFLVVEGSAESIIRDALLPGLWATTEMKRMTLEILWRVPPQGDGRTLDSEQWERGDYARPRTVPHPFARTGVPRDGYNY